MNKIVDCLLVTGLCATAFLVGNAQSQQEEPKQPASQAEAEAMQVMMKAWMQSITPGDGHKVLEHFIGEWDATTKIWMQGPTAPPTEAKGSSKMKWVLGGRFIMDEMKGETIGPDGKGGFGLVPMEGIGLSGYENFNQRYVGCWADNQNTHLLSFSGTYDPSTKTFTYEGEMAEPMLNIKSRKVKYVTRITGADSHVFEIYDLAVAPDYKVIEISYNRKK